MIALYTYKRGAIVLIYSLKDLIKYNPVKWLCARGDGKLSFWFCGGGGTAKAVVK